LTETTQIKLSGLRVLVVEDSYLVARSIASMLEGLGCRVVGPYSNVRDAMAVVESSGCDVGVLDINLGRETSEPVAHRLKGRGLPFVFVSGYLSPGLKDPEFIAHRRLNKPISGELLASALTASLRDEIAGQ